MPVLERLTQRFYDKVRQDPMLAPIFAQMSSEHPRFVAQFIAEVLGGPTTYTIRAGVIHT
jgi:hemoglobin